MYQDAFRWKESQVHNFRVQMSKLHVKHCQAVEVQGAEACVLGLLSTSSSTIWFLGNLIGATREWEKDRHTDIQKILDWVGHTPFEGTAPSYETIRNLSMFTAHSMRRGWSSVGSILRLQSSRLGGGSCSCWCLPTSAHGLFPCLWGILVNNAHSLRAFSAPHMSTSVWRFHTSV